MEDEYHVDATPKDLKYYAPFYKKILDGKLKQNEKWRKITEQKSEHIENPTKEIIQELQKRLERYTDNIAKLCEKMSEDLDENNNEFMEYVKEQLYYKEKQRVNSIRKKTNAQNAKKEMQATMQKKYDEDRAFRRNDHFQKKSQESSYRRLLEIEETLPSYIHQALSRLPNHKGYIFRGVWYFGKLPSDEKYFISMMERQNQKNLIHEYHYDGRGYKQYQCFEKTSNGRKQLLQEWTSYNSKYIF